MGKGAAVLDAHLDLIHIYKEAGVGKGAGGGGGGTSAERELIGL